MDTDHKVYIPAHQRRVGYVPQASWLFPLKSVRQNLEFGRPTTTTLSTQEVIEALGIADLLDRRPRMLSGGERQRVALGRAVLSEPELLVCDEPFSAVDPERRRHLVDMLGQWRARLGIPLLFASHQAEDVETLADECASLLAGKLAAGTG